MMVFLALLPGVFVVWCWAKASGLGSEGQYDACRMWLGVRGDRIPPLVGRVAHRERSERCDGWGIAHGSARTSHLLKQPPNPTGLWPATLPTRGRDKQETTPPLS